MRAVLPTALALAAAAAFVGSPAAAQRRELTVVAGMNFSGATGENLFKSEARSGVQAGLSLRLPRSSRFSFQTELIIVQRRIFGERAPSSQSPSLVGPRADAANLVYAQIPMLLRLQKGYSTQRPVRPFVVVGPYIGIRLSCQRVLTAENGATIPNDCTAAGMVSSATGDFFPAAYQEFDAGVLGELGLEVRRFALHIRGEKSIRNLVDKGAVPTSPLDNARLWSGSVSLEYLIRVL